MLLYLAFIVITFACEDFYSKHFESNTYLVCVFKPNSNNCKDFTDLVLENIRSCVVESQVLASSQSIKDFWTGFYNGIQLDPAIPSSCVRSFTKVQSTFDTFIEGIQGFGFTPIVQSIYTANNFVAQVSNTYNLCKFTTLYNFFHPGQINMYLSSIAAHILSYNKSPSTPGTTFNSYYSSFFTQLKLQNYISAGINFGKMFSIVANYNL